MKTPLVPVRSLRALATLLCGALLAGEAASAQEVVPADQLLKSLDRPLTRSSFGPKTEKRSGYSLQTPGETRGQTESGATRSLFATAVTVESDAKVSLPNIRFKLNSSSELADEVSKRQIEELAKALKTQAGANYLIEGHTCSIGTDIVNNRLSAERADFVVKTLVNAGIPAASLKAIGCGAAESHKDDVKPDAGEASLAPYRKVMVHKIASE